MASKKEYEETFNKILGVSVKWSLLRKEDLMQLAILFTNPELLLKKLNINSELDAHRRRLIGAGVETLKEIAENWDGPLAKFVKRILKDEILSDIKDFKLVRT